VIEREDFEEPLVGEVACVDVGSGNIAAFGCGELSDVTIADDLGMASAKGRINGMAFDIRDGDELGPVKISINVKWGTSSPPLPHADGGFFFGGTFIGIGGGVALAREAHDGVVGGVSSPKTGRKPLTAIDGAILAGLSGFLEVGA
jgi:hypothetical protein